MVLVNLLSNALKFTRHQMDAVIEAGWRRDLDDSAHHTCFVKDNGAGFDMQYVDKLFRVFQRLHRADEYAGTGKALRSYTASSSDMGGESGSRLRSAREPHFSSHYRARGKIPPIEDKQPVKLE